MYRVSDDALKQKIKKLREKQREIENNRITNINHGVNSVELTRRISCLQAQIDDIVFELECRENNREPELD